ncbi:MarR family transcriptional regulator [Clostridium sp. Marseille-Q2269]|uniref:MarR family winged helix-turn-helix transcriptional regulator n=1 Tax=Clostridium sp. Marseille-Q2269 TaxID=2942205 RepID=UPI002072CA4A|nr:MarR family transcriptional regulator [Clostridium sp. Marseille-Q2269]
MSKSINVLNSLLVDTFNDILTIEQQALQSGLFKDISVTEIHTIEAIGMYESKSMSQVAMDLGITVGTLTTAANNLAKKEYVTRKRCEEDRRIVQIKLTKKGKLAYRIHDKFHSDMIRATIEGLTKEEETVLIKSLDKLNNFFKEKYALKKYINKGEK